MQLGGVPTKGAPYSIVLKDNGPNPNTKTGMLPRLWIIPDCARPE